MSIDATIGLPSWMSSGVCQRADPELFFPAPHGPGGEAQAEKAKSLCARCPVRGQCLSYAVATRQKYGVWGGATEEERRTMTRRNHSADSSAHRHRGLWHHGGL
jgi:WhiB family transcriptional regulator, redox-sensing transcriptional regulator